MQSRGDVSMKHLISCDCGSFQGEVIDCTVGVRAVCYCKDCQIFAAYLGKTDTILDQVGGTEVVGLRHSNIRLIDGAENLRCISLNSKGLLRWYTNCCKTPIGNTPRNFKVSHIGLIHNCIEGTSSDLEKSFGPIKLRVNTHSAKKPVKALKASLSLVAQYLLSIAKQLLSNRYKSSPLFSESGEPLVEVRVLTKEQHKKLSNVV